MITTNYNYHRNNAILSIVASLNTAIASIFEENISKPPLSSAYTEQANKERNAAVMSMASFLFCILKQISIRSYSQMLYRSMIFWCSLKLHSSRHFGTPNRLFIKDNYRKD